MMMVFRHLSGADTILQIHYLIRFWMFLFSGRIIKPAFHHSHHILNLVSIDFNFRIKIVTPLALQQFTGPQTCVKNEYY